MISSNDSIEIIDLNKNNEHPEITILPYTNKRIRQNLQGINFDEDSDDNEEWNNSDSEDEGKAQITPKRLRKRKKK